MLTTNKTNVNTIAWAKPTHVLLVCNLKISSGVSLFAVSLWTETDPKFSAAPIHVYAPVLSLLCSFFFYSFGHIFFTRISP